MRRKLQKKIVKKEIPMKNFTNWVLNPEVVGGFYDQNHSGTLAISHYANTR